MADTTYTDGRYEQPSATSSTWPDDIDAIEDEEAVTDDTSEESADLDADSDAPDDSRLGSRPRKPITKQSAVKVIAKYAELAAAPNKHLELLATAIGVKADAVDVAATIASASRLSLGALNDIAPIAEAAAESPFAAMHSVFKLDRDQVKQVWALLSVAGIVEGALTSKEQAAAVMVAEAAGKISDDDLALFEAARQLARK
ncbi:hypothetical protein [Microbacterium gorillae]|uniref:hypothetical protein n=1 Tax=Microbacterium gorillae TaxID=1231063 RepID=UPI003D998926